MAQTYAMYERGPQFVSVRKSKQKIIGFACMHEGEARWGCVGVRLGLEVGYPMMTCDISCQGFRVGC